MKTITIEQAKEVLRKSGYYVERFWTVNDVKDNHKDVDGNDITNEQALNILDRALNNDATTDQIWFSIREELNV